MATQGTIYINQPQEQIEKLEGLAIGSETIIYEVSSVFPFQLFPDKIIIDKNKVMVVRRNLFYKRLTPIPYADLLTIRMTRGILFASIDFEIRGYENNPAPITYLWPSEAIKAERYALGLAQSAKNGIDLSKFSRGEIVDKLEKIGTGGNEEGGMF